MNSLNNFPLGFQMIELLMLTYFFLIEGYNDLQREFLLGKKSGFFNLFRN